MSDNSLETIYKSTLVKLKEGKRPQIRLTPELILELKNKWPESLHKVLCVLTHTQNSTSEFNIQLIESLKTETDKETLIFLLGASEKQLISNSLMTGNMMPSEFFDILKNLLQTKNPEILEWTLRTIESMGPLNFRLKTEIINSRSGMKKIFNSHLRTCDEIINLLESQWKNL
jgi:hypothetical protein